MSLHAEYALAQYRAARHGREPLPLPGVADRRVRREFRDALLDARAAASRSGPRGPLSALLAALLTVRLPFRRGAAHRDPRPGPDRRGTVPASRRKPC